jgi:hypothetical protein
VELTQKYFYSYLRLPDPNIFLRIRSIELKKVLELRPEGPRSVRRIQRRRLDFVQKLKKQI